MSGELPELTILVDRLETLMEHMLLGHHVAESELVQTAERAYAYVRLYAINPLPPPMARLLAILTSEPTPSALARQRARAEGAMDMYARLSTLSSQHSPVFINRADVPSIVEKASPTPATSTELKQGDMTASLEQLPKHTVAQNATKDEDQKIVADSDALESTEKRSTSAQPTGDQTVSYKFIEPNLDD